VLIRPSIRTTILTGFVYFTAIFTLPLRYEVVDLNSPVRSGVRLLPFVASTALGIFFTGVLNSRRTENNMTFWTMTIATTFMSVGTGLLSNLPSSGSQTNWQYCYEVILGLGLGIFISTATFVTSVEAEVLDDGWCLIKPRFEHEGKLTSFFSCGTGDYSSIANFRRCHWDSCLYYDDERPPASKF
jgi:hypothetical protein